ncbi:NYN domain-containing protein [Planotetraspora sp. GP83]|uniref:NYN domain-containing protein n=1 Tax=Planotetraspora sp. GP83 TaxID=3156264 RepID=UPI0035197147
MDRCALFVDAGYLLADGAMAVHGTRHREAVAWDYPGLLQLLTNLSRERTGLPLLRCYWYEATVEGRRTPEHDVLADIPGLKLRLARIRPGRREGVDAQVHRDLMTLARNNAVCDAVVVSGDEDLAQVVSDAQDLGIRVTVIHISADGSWAVSRTLRQECDDLIEIGAGHLRPHVNLVAGGDSGHPNGQHQPSGRNGQHQQPADGGPSRGNGVVPLVNGSQGGGRSSSHARPAPPALPSPPAYPQYTVEPQLPPQPAPPSPPAPAPPPVVQSPPPPAQPPNQYSANTGSYSPSQLGPYTGPQPAPVPTQNGGTTTLAEAVKAAHKEGHDFGDSVARDAPALWLEAVLARKPRMPSDLEARLLQGSSLPIDFLLHDEVRHALRRGFWDALERARR